MSCNGNQKISKIEVIWVIIGVKRVGVNRILRGVEDYPGRSRNGPIGAC